MDSVKKPEMILSVVSVIGMVSLGVYGQKRLATISDEISSIREACKVAVARVSEPNKVDSIRIDGLTNDLRIIKNDGEVNNKKLLTQLSNQNRIIRELTQDIDELYSMLEIMVGQLKEAKIDIKLSKPVEEETFFNRRRQPKPQPKIQPRKQQQRDVFFDDEPDPEDELNEQLNEVRSRRNGR